jgi:hypothetical protein
MHLVLAFLLVSTAVFAQENTLGDTTPHTSRSELALWKASAAALAGASALDVASSWGRCCEQNTLLASSDRRFGARGAGIKSATLGGQLFLQYWLARKNPSLARVLGYVNFAGAGAITAVAFRNYRVPQRP